MSTTIWMNLVSCVVDKVKFDGQSKISEGQGEIYDK